MLKSVVVLLALFALSGPTLAQGKNGVANTSTTIALAGQNIMRIRTGIGGYTAEERADAVRQRLIPILSLPHLRPSDVTVTMVNPKLSDIFVRGILLLTVDETLARANRQSPEQLATVWAANLRQALPQSSVGHSRHGMQYRQGKL
jgi:hypothetical protein